jgi:hypothetical protein
LSDSRIFSSVSNRIKPEPSKAHLKRSGYEKEKEVFDPIEAEAKVKNITIDARDI